MDKIIKTTSDSKVKLEAVFNHSGQLTSNAGETLDVMAQTHFKDCAHDLRAPPNTIVTPSDNLTCKIYNPDRLQQAVDSFDLLKAAGPTPFALSRLS
jgi:hypothetical protein